MRKLDSTEQLCRNVIRCGDRVSVRLVSVLASARLPFFSHRAKSISLIVGFLFATLGALWSFLVVDRLSEKAKGWPMPKRM